MQNPQNLSFFKSNSGGTGSAAGNQ